MKTRLLALLLLSVSAFGTTPVTGHIANLNTGTPGTSGFVRFILGGMGGNQPRITGTGAIAPLQGGNGLFYVDLPADASGNISGTIYSTRDAAGTGNGEIEVGGSYTAVYYRMFVYNNGIPGPEIRVHANNGVTLDISNVTPISTTPVVTAPTGDTTYCRIDGGNCGLTGPITSTSSISAHDFIPSSTPVHDVRSSGAVCDGATNDATALQTAATASAGGIFFVPAFKTCLTNSVIAFPATASLYLAGTIKAGASMAAVIQTPLTTAAVQTFYKGGGTIDGNNLATKGLDLRWCEDTTISDLNVSGVLSNPIHLGDTGASGTSFGCNIGAGVTVIRPQALAQVASSIGVYLDNASDSTLDKSLTVVGYDAGVTVNTKNNRIAGHAWAYSSQLMTVAFDIIGSGNYLADWYADTPQAYCIHSHGFDVSVGIGVCYNGTFGGIDNVVIGVHFDQASPFSSVIGAYFDGADGSHRIAKDVDVTNTNTLLNPFPSNTVTVTKNQIRNLAIQTGDTVTGPMTLSGQFNVSATGASGNYQQIWTDTSTGNNITAKFFATDAGSGTVNYGFDPFPVAGQSATFRLCRLTNSTGGCGFNVFKGDGSSTSIFSIAPNSGNTIVGGTLQAAGGLTLTSTSFAPVFEAGAVTNDKIYTNTQALTTGTATHTLANSFTYTSSATFGCSCTDQTAAAACRAAPASATTVTLAGTGSDVLWLSCSGH